MRLSISALAAGVAAVQAFRDTSPFLMFSNTPLPESLNDASRAQLQSSTQILQATKEFLSTCPSDFYYIYTQPSLSTSLLSSHAPHLKKALSHSGSKSSLAISEVVGLKLGDCEELVEYLKQKCGAQTGGEKLEEGKPFAVSHEYKSLEGSRNFREETLGQNDYNLYSATLKDMPKYSYTFILLSTPPTSVVDSEEASLYEPSFNEPLHMDLKRNIYIRDDNSSNKTVDMRPLFEKYQFFTPGLFMGLLVGTIMISILSVGLSAINSLQVSYGAFDKEMGPAAQKKQQ